MFAMEMTVRLSLSKENIESYLDGVIEDSREYDEFCKRKNIIRIICRNAVTHDGELQEMIALFDEIVAENRAILEETEKIRCG